MHQPLVYRWIHKLHHRSVSPNLLTTLSVSPLESIINGGFVPMFLAVFTVHDATMALILPTNIVMGLYVHSGYEFMPRWWNRSWATKWRSDEHTSELQSLMRISSVVFCLQ